MALYGHLVNGGFWTMANLNHERIIEILGIGSGLAFIFAWQSPKLLREVRLLLKDWRAPKKEPKPPKTPQIPKPR